MVKRDKKLNILFVYDHPHPEMWQDGLWMALNHLERWFDIDKCNLFNQSPEIGDYYDFVLGWGGFNSPVDNLLSELNTDIKKGLCIGGNAFPYHHGYDVLFYETEAVKNILGLQGYCVKAFGINTKIFKDYRLDRFIDYLGVGSFASWKRWEYFKNRSGLRLIAGEYQEGNEEESLSIVRDLMKNGIACSPSQTPQRLSHLYNVAMNVYIPADVNGGGERAVMEARACGCNVEINNDNPKLKELLDGPIFNHIDYANSLKKGIYGCFK